MTKVPNHVDLLWPVLDALRDLGGVARVDQLDSAVVTRAKISESVQSVMTLDGRPQLRQNLRWTRTALRKLDLIEGDGRGVWRLTDEGRSAERDHVRGLWDGWRKAHRVGRNSGATEATASVEGIDVVPQEARDPEWQENVLAVLLNMSPERFEHLARLVLVAEGFVSVNVTKYSKDGGIDGYGVYRLSLLSLPVHFQCKRSSGVIRVDKIRAFRGALRPSGEYGLFITTGTFTQDAHRAAIFGGAPPINPVDGAQLCELLRRHALGVAADGTVDKAFFDRV